MQLEKPVSLSLSREDDVGVRILFRWGDSNNNVFVRTLTR